MFTSIYVDIERYMLHVCACVRAYTYVCLSIFVCVHIDRYIDIHTYMHAYLSSRKSQLRRGWVRILKHGLSPRCFTTNTPTLGLTGRAKQVRQKTRSGNRAHRLCKKRTQNVHGRWRRAEDHRWESQRRDGDWRRNFARARREFTTSINSCCDYSQHL